MRKRSPLLIGSVATLIATILVVVGLNFIPPEKKLERKLEHRYGATDAAFVREMGVLLGPAIVPGNRIVALQNGDRIFPAMLGAIAQAQRSITFETYIYWSGDIGKRFADSLSERARAGVKVHVLIDWVGSLKMEAALLQELRDAGADVQLYHPLKWYHVARMNNRTHRKLLVVDGRIGFTGGVGIADQWLGNAQDPDHWREVHFQVEGPVVAQMQATFLDNWIKTTGVVLNGEAYFPPLKPVGTESAHMFSSSPSGGSESMQLMYLMAIAAAEREIDLAASYFVPDRITLEALRAALKRGVRVRILVPGEHIDSDSVRYASRAQWGALLEDGALIAEYQPTMFHCKTLVVDDFLASVGSTNFDARSFRLNDEASLNVYGHELAASLTAQFERDLDRARPITLRQWRDRPWSERAKERAARLFASQM